jgi:hypothetical protein
MPTASDESVRRKIWRGTATTVTCRPRNETSWPV